MADDKKNKYLKWAVIVVIFLIVLAVLYYAFRTPPVKWKEVKGGDISGTQYDIAIEAFSTLDEAKKRAIALNAKSFLVNGTNVIYKNVNKPVATDPNGTWTLYIKE